MKKLYEQIDKFASIITKYAAFDLREEILDFLEQKYPQLVFGSVLESNPPPVTGKIESTFTFMVSPGNKGVVTGNIKADSPELTEWAIKTFKQFGGLNKMSEILSGFAEEYNPELPFIFQLYHDLTQKSRGFGLERWRQRAAH